MIEDWTYRFETELDADGEVVRADRRPVYVHTSGAVVDIAASTCLSADMLDAEGKHAEAADTRATIGGQVRVCDRCMRPS